MFRFMPPSYIHNTSMLRLISLNYSGNIYQYSGHYYAKWQHKYTYGTIRKKTHSYNTNLTTLKNIKQHHRDTIIIQLQWKELIRYIFIQDKT